MRIRVLGSMEVFDGSAWRSIGAPKMRALLAVLVVHPSGPVSIDQLVAELWVEHPPKTAVSQVHGYVMRLRRALGDDSGRSLRTVAPGYQLLAGAQDVDASAFDDRVDRGREALLSGESEVAAELLRQALALWRGPAFADVPPTPLVTAEANRLTELRCAAFEARIEADLACGEHGALIGELRRYIADNPLRERPWGQLMVALYRSGRQAESLQTYQELRETLIREIGTEPCGELRRLHERVLSSELDEDTAPMPRPARPGPICQLPADIGDFVGRRGQLDAVLRQLEDRADDGPPPVAVIRGGPGIGKSTLALRAARRAAASFTDGQLYLDLAGTTAHPREPVALLGELLHTLGVAGAGIPDGVHARGALVRALLAERRMLLVLDDAASGGQVRPMLPPNGRCAVVVTSRTLLADLAGAWHIEIDVLSKQAAHQLLANIIGQSRIDSEPDQAAEILHACSYLPLAIRIAAGKLVGRPTWPLRQLRERLDDEARRLTELRLGDLGVRASFAASIDLLPEDALHAFRLLGLVGPLAVPGWVLGPLLGRPDADEVLDALVDANLLRLVGTDAVGQPRYHLHDLLRTYAVEDARAIPEPEREQAMCRFLGAWLDLINEAVDQMEPSLFRSPEGATPRFRLPEAVVKRLVGNPEAWFDAERLAVVGLVQLAADWGMDEAAWQLAASVVPYYDLSSCYQDWQRTHLLALESCRANGNLRGEAILLRGLAQIAIYRDEYQAAADNARDALALFGQIGDKRGAGLALAALAVIDRVFGRDEQALDRIWQALHIATAAEDRSLEAPLRNGLGVVLMNLGRLDEARAAFDTAWELCRELGDRHREAVVLRELSLLHDRVGDTARALAALEHAERIFENIGDERCLAHTRLRVGYVYAAHGDVAHAFPALRQATDVFAANGNRIEEAECCRLLGGLYALRKDLPSARRHLRRAVMLWRSTDHTSQAAEAESALERLENPIPVAR
ncbi:DNA-binding transcriptional activator of the SARP family [Amycolatopsis marina]|uniref:DNA-binding transcriptional activator of the SARP family n=1 Tax=Amycolatopsis marina TaxID=490629 RepID=A0A1I0ZVA9_9PSEU|nr:BTAD domain-containing putative transcriptional regulator [Amycolatopsis marina]SFB29252.1 DNA-binding transcriptional activator of the SARP family [Amycolatopsis marina]